MAAILVIMDYCSKCRLVDLVTYMDDIEIYSCKYFSVLIMWMWTSVHFANCNSKAQFFKAQLCSLAREHNSAF